jgi:hypothetical protein
LIAFEVLSRVAKRARGGSLVGGFKLQADDDLRQMTNPRNIGETETLALIADNWLGMVESSRGLSRAALAYSQALAEAVCARLIAVNRADETKSWEDSKVIAQVTTSAFRVPMATQKVLNKIRRVAAPRQTSSAPNQPPNKPASGSVPAGDPKAGGPKK